MRKIQFVDLKAQYLSIKESIDEAISSVINDTAFIGGKYVETFEKEFANLYGVKHCISVANGTDSLFIIMKMLGIGQGDEVITVANSWISSSETISLCGATPVFVDIDPVYYTIDENKLESAITSKTKAILPVHLYGQACEMDKLCKIANKFDLPIIEDCAQSHFSEFKGKRVGTVGIAGSFSFYPGKNLGAYGDAGCIITDDDDLALKFRMFARHGALRKHFHQIEGINSRMDGLQAAILTAKIPHILNWTTLRIQNANQYDALLKDIPNIIIPARRAECKHTFHLYVIRAEKRDELSLFLKENGVETAIHYPTSLPNLSAYRYLGYSSADYPVASKYQSEILSLPMYSELSYDDIKYISDIIRRFYS
ncbi:erythromycin biosynthesis sensory transduction protein eryC1 [Pararcticibacter amylolyticus]|uniref:Erythromycin biosynthesis sensory transduction protein eryC1 n=2 Tax=Pararcticibacter amylolyticus TaxID=2173175 RepID=A0A2U2PIF7_9SPHI|nr:erythromycin biosynthesis sensory transduction protein eryC1 [Pararcticibacter amylolyticus]